MTTAEVIAAVLFGLIAFVFFFTALAFACASSITSHHVVFPFMLRVHCWLCARGQARIIVMDANPRAVRWRQVDLQVAKMKPRHHRIYRDTLASRVSYLSKANIEAEVTWEVAQKIREQYQREIAAIENGRKEIR